MTVSDDPLSRVVCRLRLPMRVGHMDQLVRALESCYGPGLMIDFGIGDGEAMYIVTPREGEL